MNLVAAQSVGQLGVEVVTRVMDNLGKCMLPHVPNVALSARCLLSPEKTDLSIVVTVTQR